MSEATTEATTGTVGTEETTETPKPTEVDWKAKAREWERRAKENTKAAERLAQLEEAQKSEAQKLQEARDAAERRATEAEKANLRYRVGLQKGLSATFTEVLMGDTEEEMAAHADRLLAEIPKPTSGPPPFNGGPRTPATQGGDMNALIRRAAGHGG